MAELIARFKPGENVPAFCLTQVNAGRFVKLSATKSSLGDYQVAHCLAGERAFGVAERDSAPPTYPVHATERRVNIVRRGAIACVVPGAAITAGGLVMSDSLGRAVPVSAVAGIAAYQYTGIASANNALLYIARDAGDAGNGISIHLRNPGAASQALGVVVNGNDIVVNLATNGASAITSTAAQVAAAIAASAEANSLVAVDDYASSTGAGVVAATGPINLAGGRPAAEGRPLGQACHTVLSTAAFVEVDLY